MDNQQNYSWGDFGWPYFYRAAAIRPTIPAMRNSHVDLSLAGPPDYVDLAPGTCSRPDHELVGETVSFDDSLRSKEVRPRLVYIMKAFHFLAAV